MNVVNRPRIALIGNLANVAYQTCKFLRRKGVCADVYVRDVELDRIPSNPASQDPLIFENKPEWLKIIRTVKEPLGSHLQGIFTMPSRVVYKYRLMSQLRKYDLIESFCCTPLWLQEVGRPYVAFATGSDLRELTKENTWRGRKARSLFQNAEIVFFGPDPGHLARVRSLKLKSSYPYRQVIDTDFYKPILQYRLEQDRDKFIIFHPTNQDWSSSGDQRWTKGNDKLIRAFARFVKEGRLAKLVILDRGPDREKTKQLVLDLGIATHVDILLECNKEQLLYYYNASDIVADQFSVGSFGLIGLEAMSCGKPVLVYIHPKTMSLLYEEHPPVLACYTEDETYYQIRQAFDISYRSEIGKKAREWIMRYHHWEPNVDRLIWYFETVLGRSIVNL